MFPSRDVVITGVGVVSPIGIGADAFWQALLDRRSGVGHREGFEQVQSPHRIAAAVWDFDPKQYVKPRKALKIMCAPIQFGCAAAAMAVEHAALDPTQLDPERIGTVFGTETFFADPTEVADVFRKCTVNKDYQHDRWGEFAVREIQPLWMLKYLPNMAASHISIALDARGPSNSICQGEASGQLALIEAADLIQRGAADVVVTGGTGSQMALMATLHRGADLLSHRLEDPQRASRPFDRDRDGMVVGEGAGAVVLESAAHAAARGARPLARVAGWSRGYFAIDRSDYAPAVAHHFRDALAGTGLRPEDVDLVNANACGSRQGDAAEAQAIAEVFGSTPVVAHKSNFGNLGPGTSTVELVGSLLAMTHQVVPPTINYDTPDPACPVSVQAEIEQRGPERPVRTVVKSSLSATGQITALVLQRWQDAV